MPTTTVATTIKRKLPATIRSRVKTWFWGLFWTTLEEAALAGTKLRNVLAGTKLTFVLGGSMSDRLISEPAFRKKNRGGLK